MKKKFMTLALTAAMAASMGMTAFAGQWVQNTTGWWWQEDNGSYPVSQWKWLDGNKDGIYECYSFDANGYMYSTQQLRTATQSMRTAHGPSETPYN